MIPQGAVFLSVQTPNGRPGLYFQFEPDAPKEPRTFTVIGTGVRIHAGDVGTYRGTFQSEAGMVFHVYEIPTANA